MSSSSDVSSTTTTGSSSSSSDATTSSSDGWKGDTLSEFSRVRRIKNPGRLEDDDDEELLSNSSSSAEDDDDDDPVTPPPFRVDERVFALDPDRKDLYYPAILRQARHHDESWSFLVHYAGWNARFDQWLPAHLIRPDTPENRAIFKQQEAQEHKQKLQEQQQQQALKKRKLAASNNKSSSSNHYYYSDYCALPWTLRTVLVDECEKMTRRGWDRPDLPDYGRKYKRPARLIHNLPATVPVRKVLKALIKQQKRKDAAAKPPGDEGKTVAESNDNDEKKKKKQKLTNTITLEQIQDFCQQLGKLFESALPVCLLYPEERPQYEAWKNQNPDKSVLDVCGCEYLLRLWVRLPILLQQQPREDLGPLLTEVLVLMQKNRNALFKANSYRPLQPEEWTPLEKATYQQKQQQKEPEASRQTET